MGNQKFIEVYLQACASGKLPLSECGPAWQLGVIAVLLMSAIVALIALRMHSYSKSART